MSGEAVATTINEFLRELNLPISYCHGQGCDGAGNMAGRLSTVAAKIQETDKKALYVHCNSHCLNLCITACCKEQLVRNVMEHVCVATEFFNFSPMRFDLLVKIIEELLPTLCCFFSMIHIFPKCRCAAVSILSTFKYFSNYRDGAVSR